MGLAALSAVRNESEVKREHRQSQHPQKRGVEIYDQVAVATAHSKVQLVLQSQLPYLATGSADGLLTDAAPAHETERDRQAYAGRRVVTG